MLFFFVRNLDQKEVSKEFKSAANIYRLLMDSRMNDMYITLDAFKNFYEGSSFVDRSEFASFAEKSLAQMPDIKAFFWVPLVHEPDREDIEKSASISGFAGKQFFDTATRPPRAGQPAAPAPRWLPY